MEFTVEARDPSYQVGAKMKIENRLFIFNNFRILLSPFNLNTEEILKMSKGKNKTLITVLITLIALFGGFSLNTLLNISYDDSKIKERVLKIERAFLVLAHDLDLDVSKYEKIFIKKNRILEIMSDENDYYRMVMIDNFEANDLESLLIKNNLLDEGDFLDSVQVKFYSYEDLTNLFKNKPAEIIVSYNTYQNYKLNIKLTKSESRLSKQDSVLRMFSRKVIVTTVERMVKTQSDYDPDHFELGSFANDDVFKLIYDILREEKDENKAN